MGNPASGRATVVRSRLRVEGVVQGVGFRPFVHGLATDLGLSGFVGNDTRGVLIEVEGLPGQVAAFRDALTRRTPPLAVVERITAEVLAPAGGATFTISPSDGSGRPTARVSPDAATCDACLAEVFDPSGRRYRYPFTNCTHCGPRFTIVTGIPYDRANTTMTGFALCADCAAEYHDPTDRRFHAQPVCCPACGPRLVLTSSDGSQGYGDPVQEAAARLQSGEVVAVKGLGGYHLAALASDEAAVARLRARKHREDKPFALMVTDLASARALVHVDETAEALLTSPARPVVLLPRRDRPRADDPGEGPVASPAGPAAGPVAVPVAPSVAPGHQWLGVMLCYTPVHHLLLHAVGQPLVMTSGNVSDEPIAYLDTDARERLGGDAGIADAFLSHDRPIHTRTDDSVVRVVTGRPLLVRRARGYVPDPVRLPHAARAPVLAVGADLKNTFCLADGSRAVVSHHIGDLDNYEAFRAFEDGVAQLSTLLEITPALIAYDLHPNYLSTRYALERADAEGIMAVGVQHHHAHIASVLADMGETGPVIGVAFDGTGYGTDGTLWGGELLVADLSAFTREGHLQTVRMPGGAAAIRQPWRMAAAWLDVVYGADLPAGLDIRRRHLGAWHDVVAIARAGTGSPVTSSVGRLFDAVAALSGIRDQVTYEGQAAIELEQRCEHGETGAYLMGVDPGPPVLLRGADLIAAAAEDVARGAGTGVVSARFHRGLAEGVVTAVGVLRDRTGLTTVALSGGVFQNARLLTLLVPALEASGMRVMTPHRVPPGDGGVSLGQAAVAASG